MNKQLIYEAIKDRLLTAKKSEMSDFTQGCFWGEIYALMTSQSLTPKEGRELYKILNMDTNKYKQDIDAWEYSEFESEDE